ncbi:hypothetical protein HHX47_DHR5000768 [Lentinula edodes]|nr:hypothetical protein HHX47_DHR5000768 [Lentinula edodes]
MGSRRQAVVKQEAGMQDKLPFQVIFRHRRSNDLVYGGPPIIRDICFGLFPQFPCTQSPREIHETYEQLGSSFGFSRNTNGTSASGVLRSNNGEKCFKAALGLKKLWKGL